jgi:hypothetical protein
MTIDVRRLIEAAEQNLASKEAARDAAQAAREEAEAARDRAYDLAQSADDTRIRYAEQNVEHAQITERFAASQVRKAEAALAELRSNQDQIIASANRLHNLRASFDHYLDRLRGLHGGTEDVVTDLSETNRAMAEEARKLSKWYPDAESQAEVERPHLAAPLPLNVWLLLAPEEARQAIATARDPAIPGLMEKIIQSSATDRYAQANALSQRMAEADRVLSALMPAQPASVPSEPGMPELVLGESKMLTSH